jgi:hypothetical protein
MIQNPIEKLLTIVIGSVLVFLSVQSSGNIAELWESATPMIGGVFVGVGATLGTLKEGGQAAGTGAGDGGEQSGASSRSATTRVSTGSGNKVLGKVTASKQQLLPQPPQALVGSDGGRSIGSATASTEAMVAAAASPISTAQPRDAASIAPVGAIVPRDNGPAGVAAAVSRTVPAVPGAAAFASRLGQAALRLSAEADGNAALSGGEPTNGWVLTAQKPVGATPVVWLAAGGGGAK